MVRCFLKGTNDRSEELDTVEPRTCCVCWTGTCCVHWTEDMLCALECDLCLSIMMLVSWEILSLFDFC